MKLRLTLQKKHSLFPRDNFDFQNDQYRITCRGVLVNKEINNFESCSDFLISEYKKYDDNFVNNLRGSFIIYLKDISKGCDYVYTNHLGDKPVYYATHNNEIFISDDINKVIADLKSLNNPTSINKQSMQELLTFGYLLADKTMFEGVEKLHPGTFIKIDGSGLSFNKYYQINNEPEIYDLNQNVMDELDHKFQAAVKLQFDRDLVDGKQHITSLSGGLDSRMTTVVAHKLGYKNLTCSTFSQSNHLDMSISKQIAHDIGGNWISTSLDGGNFISNIDKVIKITGGRAYFAGQSHGLYAYEKINHEKFGIYHTGQVGDVIIGSFNKTGDYKKPYFEKAISNKYSNLINGDIYNNYKNQELFLLENRALNGALTGNLTLQTFTETMSPFLDIDLINFCMKIHTKHRSNHQLYHKWIIEKYPLAASYIWENTGRKITDKKPLSFKGVPLAKVPSKVLQKTIAKLPFLNNNTVLSSANHMNPFGYWYKTNLEFKNFVHLYHQENIDRIEDTDTKQMINTLFKSGHILEKLQAMSLLSVYKNFI